MRFLDLVSLIFYNLSRRKGRVLLTAVGVVIGTSAVVVLVSLAVGLRENATKQLWGINDLTSIEVYPGYSFKGNGGGGMMMGGGGEIADIKYLTPNAIKEFEAIPGVKKVIVEDYFQGNLDVVYGKLHGYSSLMGINLDDLADMGLEVNAGTTELVKGTAIVGSWINRNFYDPKARPDDPPVEPPDLMGQTLKFVVSKWSQDGMEIKKTYSIKIVGVLKESRGQADGSIFMRLEDVTAWNEWVRGTRINRNKEGYSNVIVKVESPEQVIDITDQINTLGYMAYTPQATVQGINSFFTILQVIFGGVGAIALLVAAIGIANTMAMAILERTREIGLMKAIGATNKDVMSIFLGEAAGIGFIGGLGGVIFGWGASAILNIVAVSYYASQASEGGGSPLSSVASTPFWLPAFALIFATVIGLISGLYPALRAATLVPVTALKYE
jgi:putative ABC transport system permease protein